MSESIPEEFQKTDGLTVEVNGAPPVTFDRSLGKLNRSVDYSSRTADNVFCFGVCVCGSSAVVICISQCEVFKGEKSITITVDNRRVRIF